MNAPISSRASVAGFSLMEVVIAIGVLAVTLPLVFAVMVRSSQSTVAAQAETRCAWIIPACINEIMSAYDGKSSCLPTLTRNQQFPLDGDILALAFAGDGHLIGSVERESYTAGIKQLTGQPVRYIVSIHATHTQPQPATSPMLNLRLTLEYPSVAAQANRRKLDFHTRIP
jgi:type II secretory pathway pseudopilin PulG